jgi:hypothetical protein
VTGFAAVNFLKALEVDFNFFFGSRIPLFFLIFVVSQHSDASNTVEFTG